MAQLQLDENRLFAGRYRVVRCIAAGGMGAVYEVLHVETQRRRALKVMLPMLVASADLRERFQREARVTANVNSEYIIDVFDAGVDQDTSMPFLVMDLLQGEELGERVKRLGALEPADVLAYLRQTASALDKTHAAGIVHRDLKPENLFLTQRDDGSPRIKILHFGISKVVSNGTTGANATQSLGTPLYMAPEQVMGEPVSAATDLYALGFIVYTLLVGVSYWQEETERFETAFAFAVHACKGPPESPSARAARVGKTLPAGFDEWFFKATQVNPAQRFTRASEQCAALARVLGDSQAAPGPAPALLPYTQVLTPAVQAVTGAPATQAAAPTPAQTGPTPAFAATRAPAPANRQRPLVLAIAAGLVLASGAGATALWMHRSPQPSVETSASAATEAPPSAAAPSVVDAIPPPTPNAEAPSGAASAAPAAPAPSLAPSAANRPVLGAFVRHPAAAAPAPKPPTAAPTPVPTPAAAPAQKYTRD